MPKGKKICPECSAELGVRTYICSCGHEFKKKIKKEVTPISLESATIHTDEPEEQEKKVITKKRTKVTKHKGDKFTVRDIDSVCKPIGSPILDEDTVTFNNSYIRGSKLNEILPLNAVFNKIVANIVDKSISVWVLTPDGEPDYRYDNVLV